MRKLILVIAWALLGLSMTHDFKKSPIRHVQTLHATSPATKSAPPTETIVVNTGNFTITNAHDNQTIVNTGGACTYTLSATTTNFVCNIVNQGTGNITLSTAVTVRTGVTVNTVGFSISEMFPNRIGNRLKIHRDASGVWRSI